MQDEPMNDIDTFCPHKDQVNAYCQKCETYLCKTCQLNDHFDHIESIKGLDAMFSQAVQKYEMMNSELEKTLLRTEPQIKNITIDETLLAIEKKIIGEYDKLTKDIKGIEEDHISMIESSPLLHKIQELKDNMEDQGYKALVEFDKKLENTIKKLLETLNKEDFESVAPLLTDAAKDEFTEEFKKHEPYIERQKELLKQIESFKEIKPKLTYSSRTIEDLIQVKGVHEETVRLILYSPDDSSIYIHYPKVKIYKKKDIKPKLTIRKFAQVVVESDMLFLCGGKRKHKEYSNKNYMYALVEQKLNEKADMNEARCCHGIANRKDIEIYVVGGMNETDALASAEVYDIKENTWKVLPSISKGRKNCTLCLVSEKYLYLIGGIKTSGEVEVLNLNDIRNWEIKTIKNAPPVEKAGAIQIADNQILVFGGKTNGKKTSSCMIYDLPNEAVIPKAALPNGASFNKADTRRLDGMIYSSGNTKGQTYMYDKSLNEWTVIVKNEYTLKYGWD